MKHALGLCTIWLSSPSPWSHWPLLTCPCSQPGPGRTPLRPLKKDEFVHWCTYFMLPKGELAMFQKDDKETVTTRQVWKLSCYCGPDNGQHRMRIRVSCNLLGLGSDLWKPVSLTNCKILKKYVVGSHFQELSIPLDERCDDRSYQWFCGCRAIGKARTAWTLSKPASKGVELTRLSSTASRTQCNVCSFFFLCGSPDW